MECKVKGHSWLVPAYRFYSVAYQSGPIVGRGSSSYEKDRALWIGPFKCFIIANVVETD